ncbi:MAG: hypothetical protein JNK82_17360 [Myxococcaceae bacterium]|nr:hypothetical protein [Myxococcaceae bacterium]
MAAPLTLLSVALLARVASAQAPGTPVPEKHIPGSVLMELRAVESQFDLYLGRDCAPERCASKGCVYRDHAVVDLPRNSSLPGLPNEQGLGAVPAQEYLTKVHCEFAHEKSVPLKDVEALKKRLEQRLSKGWLTVTVGRSILEPISPGLSVSPPPLPENVPAPKVEPPPAPAPPQKWEAEVALRELWVALLPHFSWMIALLLVTLATLSVIWGLRRVGKETLEEKALSAQLLANPPKAIEAELKPEDGEAGKEVKEGTVLEALPAGEDPGAFVAEQQKVWTQRVSEADLGKDEGGVVELLRSWLAAREYDLLAKAILVFGDRLSLAFSSDGEYAVRKVEFADYLRNMDERRLPSDAEFFKKLNQHAIASSLMAQADAEIYRSLREEFGSAGVANLVEQLPARNGALLFAVVPADCQLDVARVLSRERRLQVAEQLLASNRINRQDREHLFPTLDAARSGKPFPKAPLPAAHEIADRGREVDAAGALSMLLQYVDPQDRKALFEGALSRSSGVYPGWYDEILYPDMLMKLPPELRSDLLLEVDIKSLAGWASVQPASFQGPFVQGLPNTMQQALRANQGFGSRTEQWHLAQSGREQLVQAVKKQLARGRVSFSAMVA